MMRFLAAALLGPFFASSVLATIATYEFRDEAEL